MRVDQSQTRSTFIMLVVFVLVGAVVGLPVHMNRLRVEKRIDKARDELGMTSSSGEALKDVYSEVMHLREVINSSQGNVPQEDELANILRGLSEALKQAGVTDKELITRETSNYANYSVIPVAIEFSGDFRQTERALRLMEQMPRLIRIDSLTVRGDSRDQNAPLRVTLKLSTFFSDSERGEL